MGDGDYIPDGPQEVFDQAKELLSQGVVKVDHFENIYRLEKKFEGVPNWRNPQGFQVFGSGQPTIPGLELTLQHYCSLGIKKLLCVNMRSEPVIYANQFSYGPRNPNNLNENIEISGLSVRDVQELQNFLVAKVRATTRDNNNTFTYHKDTYALVPEDRKDYTQTETARPEDICSLTETYARENSKFPQIEVKILRLPVNDERVPNLEDFDRLVKIIEEEWDEWTGAHFNCQMGKGRTTTGMVLCCLTSSKLLRRPIPRPAGHTDSPDSGHTDSPDSLENGDYAVIRRLVGGVEDGARMKWEMDSVIDACDHMQNLRKCIWEAKVAHDKELAKGDESGSRRAAFWYKLGVNFIERYFYLILFNVYLTHRLASTGQHKSFVEFCAARGDLTSLLGTRQEGYLATFNWE